MFAVGLQQMRSDFLIMGIFQKVSLIALESPHSCFVELSKAPGHMLRRLLRESKERTRDKDRDKSSRHELGRKGALLIIKDVELRVSLAYYTPLFFYAFRDQRQYCVVPLT
ncbi:hypothetical protein IFM89_004166 [Coptis chinensis]|uniref:Uncharacterized protein n=1 Tax=Coptis chinensis TaxID=261450 RepID=A0A835H4K4_9MAGN|nr:hypothetical protein IFM89_004166 [Coptis chinensis]